MIQGDQNEDRYQPFAKSNWSCDVTVGCRCEKATEEEPKPRRAALVCVSLCSFQFPITTSRHKE